MATVTKEFRDDFETWAADRVSKGQFTAIEMDEFKDLLRRDLTPGADTLRSGLVVSVGGVDVSAAIDNHQERYQYWAEFFRAEAMAIRQLNEVGVRR